MEIEKIRLELEDKKIEDQEEDQNKSLSFFMPELSVNDDGCDVYIEQNPTGSRIKVHYDQIDILIKWLEEIKENLVERYGDGRIL